MNDKLFVMLKMSDLSPLQKDIMAGKVCPYCNSPTKSVPQKEIYGKGYSDRMVICCVNYPACDSYVGTHDDGTALGRLARQELRFAKKKAKEVFDRLWQCAYLKRENAYEKLAEFLEIDRDLCHFGMFKKETCEKAGKWALDYIVEHSEKPKSYTKYIEDKVGYTKPIPENKTFELNRPKKTLWFIQKIDGFGLVNHKWLEIPEANDDTFAELKKEGRDIIGAFPTKKLAVIWTDFYNGKIDKEELNEQLQKLEK